ncbi:LTA synthase family protein [Clostridium sp. YIM B02505]|uniref:LTA synthase family protein n=1 Tax=Clostridium yunnanense TaxID=2800325 RepID=A0ABS1END0_9CLOT|nr:LTA synthase family protein [Clostridium yunnanense]MBK1810860.1 LTA synthase family protein [Clostridium yunnanense]
MIKRLVSIKNSFRIINIVSIIIKTILFTALFYSADASVIHGINLNSVILIYQASIILLICSAGFMLKGRSAIIYGLVINIIYTLIILLDLWYYRGNWSFLGFRFIFYKDLFYSYSTRLINFRAIDLVFIADIIIFLILFKIKVMDTNVKSRIRFCVVILLVSIFSIGCVEYLVDVRDITKGDIKLFKRQWSYKVNMMSLGPIAYHVFEAYDTFNKISRKEDKLEMTDVKKWIQENKEELPDNEFKGMFKGKNIIFLQIESMENFVINKKAEGQEITPNLNRMLSNSLYFDNIFEQNNGGNSIDCDMMVNTSVFPLGDRITFLDEGQVEYFSLPKLLKDNGYYSVSAKVDQAQDWNWGETHKLLNFDEKWDVSKFEHDEYVGFGLSDRTFLSQISDKIDNIQKPFYLMAATESSHGPFDIDKEHRNLKLPNDIDKTYLGGYFQSINYADSQIGMFVKKLEDKGLLDNTVLVIYGDHGGVHKYYNDKIKDLHYDNDWWNNYDKRIPLIMYSKDLDGKVIHSYGGQVDFMPTIAYLVGNKDKEFMNYIMGRVLVNTKRDATIIKSGIIQGHVNNDDERRHVEDSYSIGKKFILNDYYRNNYNNK